MIEYNRPKSRRRSQSLAVGAIVLLTSGMAAAGLGYGVFGPPQEAGIINPALWPPRWMFWAVWMLLYPATGVAGALLYETRQSPEGTRAWRWFVVSVVFALLWIPVVQASGSQLVAPVLMDLASGLAGLTAFLAARRASIPAFLWLVPINAWGIITTVLKIWRLLLNM